MLFRSGEKVLGTGSHSQSALPFADNEGPQHSPWSREQTGQKREHHGVDAGPAPLQFQALKSLVRCVIGVKRADSHSQTSQDWRAAHSGDPEPSPSTSLPRRPWGCLGAWPGDAVPWAWSPLPSAAAEPGLCSVPSAPSPAGCWLATLLRGAGGHHQHPSFAFTAPGRTKGRK